MLTVSNNLLALNSANQLKTNVNTKVKSMEKLSTGYRINKAADDAAGLSISEKMRTMIRGLDQGTKNVQDGASWVQTGDGALHEAQAIMHRMTELTVQSLNDTNTDEDRMALELEFESLQSELDRISGTTEFNTMPIFEEHDSPYYQCEGNIRWDPQQIHVISAGSNDLSLTYRTEEGAPQQSVTITVPPGQYTTQELVDEIASALDELPDTDEELILEFTKDGTCNVNLEKGVAIDSVSGGLSFLLNKVYGGGGFGALIGTTEFPREDSKLKIVAGKNDTMTFTIEDFSGKSTTKTIVIQPPGGYTKSQLIDILNDQLKDTTVKAVSKGTGIKLQSDDAIVTGFKGNMFQIDNKSEGVYDSVFYDNTKYGTVDKTEASFTGGFVLPTDSRDKKHQCYEINSANNTLILQPNTSKTPVILTIPEGRYNIKEMEEWLNNQFKSHDLDLTATAQSNGNFQGLFLKSGIKGLDSHINLDPTSSAYNTLFVSREYNKYGPYALITNETRVNKEGTFTGSRDLSGISSSSPLEIKKGVNDSFTITINGTSSTITLTEDKYTSLQQVLDELDKQLNGNPATAAYKGKTTIWPSNGRIMLGGVPDEKVDSIIISANGSNQGYNDIFVGYREYTLPDKVHTGSATLDTPFDGDIDPSQGNMTIVVDGKEHDVTLPTGPSVTPDDIIDAIENQIPPETIENKFPPVSAWGTSGDQNFSSSATGKNEPLKSWSGSQSGSSYKPEGIVDFITNDPAKLTIGPALKDSMQINSSNNQIKLSLNGKTQTLTLDDGVYTPDTLVTHLQNKIDETFGKELGGAIVSLEGKNLVLESRLPEPEYNDGAKTSISCSTDTSSFLKDLNSIKHPAEWTSELPLSSDINLDGTNNRFEFQLSQNGNSSLVSVNLRSGHYTPSTIVTELNRQLAGKGVTASLSDGNLVLTSVKEGNDVTISYSTKSGGNSVEALFGSMTEAKPAQALLNQKTESPIVIAAGATDTLKITVNKKDYEITLDAGRYDRQSFTNMLNKKFAENNIDLKAYTSGNKLGFQTVSSKGPSASFSVEYEDGGTAMKAIFGVTEVSGIKADFTSDGKLHLTTTKPGSTIKVPSSSGGPFQPATEKRPISPNRTNGYHSNTNSKVQGQPLAGDIEINQWNSKLTFSFRDNEITKTVSIEVPSKTYTYSELQSTVQSLVDGKIGAGKVNVTVDGSGVRFEAAEVGSKYQFSNFSGGFYDEVLGHASEMQHNDKTENIDGTQTISPAFTVGRKDVKNNITEIRTGYSDQLSLDLTYGGVEYPINITLDEGDYTGQALQKHLQDKINEQLAKQGLEENTIKVGLGDIVTGVQNANDKSAINFSLPASGDGVKMPEEGTYKIDGVKGNAAFEIFYQTEGKIIPSYIVGTKDISKGVTLGPDDVDFSLEVDGVPYPVKLTEGEYPTPDELIAEVTRGLEAAGAPLFATMEDGCLKISHKQTGEHLIDKVEGGARDTLFYTEKGDDKEKQPFYVKPNSIKGDHIAITRQRFSTAYLKINSICISKPKYAEKALERLNTALEMTSEIRSYFGATQNRLESASRNNRNIAENTQSSESRLRDADMASEMVNFANSNILQQANAAILAQANQQPQGILSLFQ